MKQRAALFGILSLALAGCSSTLAAPESAQHQAPAPLAASATEPAKTTVTVRDNGTLSVNGQAMFPMGFYHVSWAGDAERRMRDLHAIADLGFNTVNTTMFDPEEDIEGYRQLLDAAQTRGVKMLVEDFNETSVNTFKSHPALLGWMVADDCNNLVTPQELQRRSERVKAIDPNHLTYTSMAISFSNSHTDYFGRADAVGNQSYPVGGGDAVNVVYPVMTRLVAEARAKGTLPIANLQSFRWKDGRYPTPRELSSMTNQAIAAGVKGILYYTYLDPTNDLAKYGGLNDELRQLAAEVKQLAPALTEGQRVELPVVTGGSAAKAHLWTYGGRRFVQVISLEEEGEQAVKVQLPSATTMTPLFAGRSQSLTLRQGVAGGTLAPLAAEWYELQ